MDFSPSPKSEKIRQEVVNFIEQKILPLELLTIKKGREASGNHKKWTSDPQVESLKKQAQQQGLWNLFLPEGENGLSNLDYAPIAEATGRTLLAPEIFNCNAPDSGNMELLWKYGSEKQKAQWLGPLMRGEIRSAFCMTEPDVASSDATNMKATINAKADQVLINGRKWWSTGLGHPNCRLLIVMGLSLPDADQHRRHSMALVPSDAEGVSIERMLPVFGTYDPPYGHGEVSFNNVLINQSDLIGQLGDGFSIAQGRLGPGRIHHCMRLIGMAERALEMMVERSVERVAFGKPLFKLGGNADIIANARMNIEMARLLTLKAAYQLDHYGIKQAISEVSQIKVIAPRVACEVIDQAIQMFGGAGLSDDTALASMYSYARIMRLADGPDEVHLSQIAKVEMKKIGLQTSK
ncbi:MAG: acyl-CoA dehydrogenase [Paraglaciecola sp.]|jgi:acyl-CoA dehydrogenase